MHHETHVKLSRLFHASVRLFLRDRSLCSVCCILGVHLLELSSVWAYQHQELNFLIM